MAVRADRTWIELSRSALRSNLRSLQSIFGKVAITPVVKANAYGHGLPQIISILKDQKIWGVSVAYDLEALQLRTFGYRGKILVLSYWSRVHLPRLVRENIDIVVGNMSSLRSVISLPRSLKRRIRIHLKLDSGTTRIGFLTNQLPKLKLTLNTYKIKPVGIFSHLANSESASTRPTIQQIKYFTTLSNFFPLKQGITVHLACTAAGLRYPGARFDLIRLGIGLYGLWPSQSIKDWAKRKLPSIKLRPVLTWKSRIIQLKDIPAGTAIGYGSTVRVRVPTRIGIIPVGYSDGYDRRASNVSWVMVQNRPAKVLGRISMNLLVVKVQGIPKVRVGSEVILLGPGISAEQFARMIGTINYEVVSRLNPEIPRVFVP